MFTPLTQAAVVILSETYMGAKGHPRKPLPISKEETAMLLCKLAAAGFIRRVDVANDGRHLPESAEALPTSEISYGSASYCLARRPSEISLFDILEAIEEPLDCTKEVAEDFYITCRAVAQKLGAINEVARLYLKQIKLCDL